MSDASSSTYKEDEALLNADTPVGDQDLLRTFKKVLASGVNMIQHGATGPAVQIHLCLRKNVLYWSGMCHITITHILPSRNQIIIVPVSIFYWFWGRRPPG